VKCRRRNHNGQAPAEYYWDRQQQLVVAVGWGKRGGSSNRKLRRHGAVALDRKMKQNEATDHRVDKLIRVALESEGRVTRVGDKFLLHEETS